MSFASRVLQSSIAPLRVLGLKELLFKIYIKLHVSLLDATGPIKMWMIGPRKYGAMLLALGSGARRRGKKGRLDGWRNWQCSKG
jgi:hypothetical protein